MLNVILPESFVHVDLVSQPWVDRSPEGRSCLFVEPLLNDAQPFSVFSIKRTGTVNRMIAPVGHAIVMRPFFRRFGKISHKKKKRPQFSPRPLSVPPYLLKNLKSLIRPLNVLEQIVPVSSNLKPFPYQ